MSDPHSTLDRRWCARLLLQQPLLCREFDPEAFRLVRRHERELDRWFTQRLGYRLHVTADTARLYKTTVVPDNRPLMTVTSTPRPFAVREYVQLSLVLAAVASGPVVISLRDLIDRIRTAAADASIILTDEPVERRALVTALQWMVGHGLAAELHERVSRYATDAEADAVLQINPDRIALLPLPVLGGAQSADEVLDRSAQRRATRQWMRAQLVEEPVIYRENLTDGEWTELRRRLGEEADMLDEMFGLTLEARAEGVAAVDVSGELSDRRLPATGTTGHAALLLIERLAARDGRPEPWDSVVTIMTELVADHRRHWSKLADDVSKLTIAALDLLADHRLVHINREDRGDGDVLWIQLLPFAHRFAVDTIEIEDHRGAENGQQEMW